MLDNALVIDTSALAALLFGEPGGPKVAESLEGKALFAPTLLRYELASVCLKKARKKPKKEARLVAALGLFPRLQVREVQVPTEGLLEMARDTGLTAYDAAYLWLSRELNVELVTLDARLKAAEEGGK